MDIPRPEQRRRRKIRRLALGVSAALIMTVAAVGLARREAAAPPVPRTSIWVDEVRRGEMLLQVTGPGTLIPREVRWIAAQSEARVDRILVRPGALVEPDTVIVETSNPDLLQEMATAEYELKSAEAALAEARIRLYDEELDQRVALAGARAEYESARLQAEAEEPLAKQGIVPALQHQRSKLSQEQLKVRMDTMAERLKQFAATMKLRLEAQHALVEQKRAIYERRKEQVEALRVRAGISGVLQEMLVAEGQRIALGASIARIARPDELQAQLQIPQSQAHYVQIGQAVTIDMRTGLAQGRVVRIDPAVQAGTVKVDVELIGEMPRGARVDLSVDGTIEIERLNDAMFMARPASAQAESTINLFRLVEDGAYAERVTVRLGRVSARAVEIVEGLSPGDRVILSDMSQWSEHARIRIAD